MGGRGRGVLILEEGREFMFGDIGDFFRELFRIFIFLFMLCRGVWFEVSKILCDKIDSIR